MFIIQMKTKILQVLIFIISSSFVINVFYKNWAKSIPTHLFSNIEYDN
jgi:hypothetical protein